MTTTPSTSALRITHCSDIHLDGDNYDDTHYRDGFVNVLGAAVANGSQLVLLPGDLFDTNRASDEIVQWAMRTLEALPLPVVMIPGNHDCLQPDGVYARYDFSALRNVTFLTAEAGEWQRLDELGVAVWGKGMVDHCAEYHPIGDVAPGPEGVDWYLGLGHGIYVPDERESDRSSPVYQHQIAASPFDYLALGHHHAALEVHEQGTAAAYCGSPTDLIGAGATYAVIDLFDPATGTAPEFSIELLD